jgi:predicted ATPase
MTPKSCWFVLTGAPSSGKTTTINRLFELGFPVVREAARRYIEKELADGKTLPDIRANEAEFQQRVLAVKIAMEAEMPQDGIVFFDRGIIDSKAFFALRNTPETPELQHAIAQAHYGGVFLFEPLPLEEDAVRMETPEEQERIHKLLKDVYTEAGYTPVVVPAKPLAERVAFILDTVRASAPCAPFIADTSAV